MDEAGTVEQDIDRSHFLGQGFDGGPVSDVEDLGSYAGKLRQAHLVDVGGQYVGALSGKQFRRCLADSLTGRCN